MATLAQILAAKSTPQDPLEQAQNQVENDRWKLQQLGLPDPTTTHKPNTLERIFGIIDVPGAGIRSLVHNAVNPANDKDVSALAEMGKAFRGEKRLEGSEIVGDLGVDNKWAKMGLGFLANIVLDPVTWTTAGFGALAKSGGRSLISNIATHADDVSAFLRAGKSAEVLAPLAESLGKNVDDVSRIITAFDKAGHFDEVGKLKAVALAGIDEAAGRAASQTLMRDAFKEYGKGGVKFAGMSLGGEGLVSKLGFKSKELARKLPGARWFEQSFTMGDLPGDTVDLFRGGNEAVNAIIKGVRKSYQGKKALSELIGARFGEDIAKDLPDDMARMFAGKAYAEAIQPELDEIMDAMKVLSESSDEAAREAAQATIAAANARTSDALVGRISESMMQAGYGEDVAKRAAEAVLKYKSKFDDVLTRQQALGIDQRALLGVDSLGYQFGMAPQRVGKESKTLSEFYNRIGVNADELVDPSKPVSYLSRKIGAGTQEAKKYLTPLDRAFGRLRGGEAGTALKTEFDLAKTGAAGLAKQEGRILSQQMADDITRALGGGEGAKELGADIALKFERTFSNDESVKTVLTAYDKVLNAWKSFATSYNIPRFALRNGLSNKVRAAQEGMLFADGEAAATRILRAASKGTLNEADDKLLMEAVEDGVLTTGKELSEVVGGQSARNILTDNPYARFGANFNGFIENQARLSTYLGLRNRGVARDAASQLVDTTYFRYSDAAYSVFEENVMRRIVPFYKWAKNNTSAQTRLLFTRPGAISIPGQLQAVSQDVNPVDQSVMPEWMRQNTPLSLPFTDKAGNQIQALLEGTIPLGDLERGVGTLLNPKDAPREYFSSLSPLIKLPIELLTNRDVYYGDEIAREKGETRRAPGYIAQFDKLAMSVPGLSNFWTQIKDGIGAYYKEDATTGEQSLVLDAYAVKVLKDLNPWMSAIGKMVDDNPRQAYDILSYLTGIKLTPYDTQQFTRQKTFDDRNTLQQFLNVYKDENPKVTIPDASNRPKTLKDLLGGK